MKSVEFLACDGVRRHGIVVGEIFPFDEMDERTFVVIYRDRHGEPRYDSSVPASAMSEPAGYIAPADAEELQQLLVQWTLHHLKPEDDLIVDASRSADDNF